MTTEPSIRIRFANISDAKQLADLHFLCSLAQPDGFTCKLGRRFLREYYRIILKDRTTMILCADAGKDGIVGLISASLDAKEQLEAIRKGRYKLLVAVIPALIRRPNLSGMILRREKSLWASDEAERFIVGSGARLAYWGWAPNYPSKGLSISLLQAALRILIDLGVPVVRLEIDRKNRKVEMTHRLLGAKGVKEFKMDDGRIRIVMEYLLNSPNKTDFQDSKEIKSNEGILSNPPSSSPGILDGPEDTRPGFPARDAAFNR